MEKPQQDQRRGYVFMGWFIDEACTKRLNPGGILPTTMTLYDKWIPIWYKIHYELNGGMNSRLNPKYLNIESGVLRLYPARKRNMAFDYWTLNGKRVDVIPEDQAEEITLVAHYRELCTVHFESNGGGRIEDKTIGSDGLLKPFRHPLRLGYDFSGWYYDQAYTKPFTFDQKIKESCTLYAKWDLVYYRIHYDAQGGIASRKNPHVYTYLDEDKPLLPAQKKGYVFEGWYDLRGNLMRCIVSHSIGDKHLFDHYRPE